MNTKNAKSQRSRFVLVLALLGLLVACGPRDEWRPDANHDVPITQEEVTEDVPPTR